MRRSVFTRTALSAATRRKVFDRFAGICYLCGKPVSFKAMHVDHIVAVSKGGPNTISNYAPTHPYCNLKKGNKHSW